MLIYAVKKKEAIKLNTHSVVSCDILKVQKTIPKRNQCLQLFTAVALGDGMMGCLFSSSNFLY